MFDISNGRKPVKDSGYVFGVGDVDELEAMFATFIAAARSKKISLQGTEQSTVANISDFMMRSFTVRFVEQIDSTT